MPASSSLSFALHFRYDLGVIAAALPGIEAAFSLSGSGVTEAIVGAAKFGAFFGTFIGGASMLRYGRKHAMTLNGLFFTLGPVLMALSPNPACLVTGAAGVGRNSSLTLHATV